MEIKLREELSGSKRLVVKVGSNVITKKNGQCDLRTLRIIVEDLCELADQGYEVVLVSSGAVSIGKAFLRKHLPEGKIDLDQSASSIGQPKLINKYTSLFSEHNHICSQILLTHDDFRNRERFLNAKRTIETLLRNSIIPILNENDSISYSEISVGDNDHLAAQTAQMISADALLIITSAKGLYDRDPSDPEARLIESVEFGQDLSHIDMSLKTASGRGGMASKVDAVNKVTQLGIKAIISSKDNSRIVLDPLRTNVGTLFGPKEHHNPERRSAWLVSTRRSNCSIEVNEKAYAQLLGGKPLSPSDVLEASGSFFAGDSVDLKFKGHVFAVGVSEYAQTEVDQIKSKDSGAIEDILGYRTSSKIVKASNLVLNGVKNEDTRPECQESRENSHGDEPKPTPKSPGRAG